MNLESDKRLNIQLGLDFSSTPTGKLDEYHSHAVIRQGGGVADLCSKRAAIESARRL